jgi:hypothetical protein
MKARALPFVGSFLVILAAACGGGGGGGDAGGDGDGDGDAAVAVDAAPTPCTSHDQCPQGSHCADTGLCTPSDTGDPCAGDANCKSGETCIGGFCGCVGDQFVAEGVPPNMMIVLDRSGSMDDPLNNSTKWQVAVNAVGNLLASYGNQVRFGLVLYQGDAGDCAPGDIVVDTGPGTTGAINNALAATGPAGFTPIGDTLDALIGHSGLADTTRDNYILLVTDGSETCNGDGVGAVTALRAQTPEVKTFVVGFGSGVDGPALNQMAQAGGTARPNGPPWYYRAGNAAELNAVFDAIGVAVLSCTYQLSGQPDIDTLHVFFDGQGVPLDPTHTDGWDYDPTSNQITFYGPACDSLRTGAVTDLVVVSGCAVPVP